MNARNEILRNVIRLQATVLFVLFISTFASADIHLRTSVTASAGGPSSCPGLTMNSTTGQSTPIGLSVNSNYRMGAGFWYQNPLPPPSIEDLLAQLDSGIKSIYGHIYLSWTEPPMDLGIAHYVIYRGTTPYQLGDSIAMADNTTYLDEGIVGHLYLQYYYHVKAVDWAGNKSRASNQVGEYDILLE